MSLVENLQVSGAFEGEFFTQLPKSLEQRFSCFRILLLIFMESSFSPSSCFFVTSSTLLVMHFLTASGYFNFFANFDIHLVITKLIHCQLYVWVSKNALEEIAFLQALTFVMNSFRSCLSCYVVSRKHCCTIK